MAICDYVVINKTYQAPGSVATSSAPQTSPPLHNFLYAEDLMKHRIKYEESHSLLLPPLKQQQQGRQGWWVLRRHNKDKHSLLLRYEDFPVSGTLFGFHFLKHTARGDCIFKVPVGVWEVPVSFPFIIKAQRRPQSEMVCFVVSVHGCNK